MQHGMTVRMEYRADQGMSIFKIGYAGGVSGGAGAVVNLPTDTDVCVVGATDCRFLMSNLRLTTLEIIPPASFIESLLDRQVEKGWFNYPNYSIQGYEIDLASTGGTLPVDAGGSRVEFTDICFVNEGQGACF